MREKELDLGILELINKEQSPETTDWAGVFFYAESLLLFSFELKNQQVDQYMWNHFSLVPITLFRNLSIAFGPLSLARLQYPCSSLADPLLLLVSTFGSWIIIAYLFHSLLNCPIAFLISFYYTCHVFYNIMNSVMHQTDMLVFL